MIKSHLLILLLPVPVLLFILQGCASAPGHKPAQWPERVITSKQDCPDISGTYNNQGSGSGYNYLFDSMTNEGVFGRHEGADYKVILALSAPDQNRLTMKLQDAAGSTLEEALLEQDKGEFSCKEGAITIKYLAGAEALVIGAIRSGTRKYYPGEDGSLIHEDHFSAAGHYFYIPLANKGIDYIRWLRADADGRKLAADYEARSLQLGGYSQQEAEAAAKALPLSMPVTTPTAEQSWEIFKLSNSRGEPDFKALCGAADQGDSRARRELGYLHYHGLHGVRKDPVLSAMWYGLIESYSQGPDSFSTGREQLTPEQLTELKSLYINWKPGHCEREISGNEFK